MENMMKLTKKQQEFVALVKKCKFLYKSEVDTTRYPKSLVNALLEKEVLGSVKVNKWDTNPKIICLVD